jgi:CDP-diacylglycerol--serine O-phosphatidyltransferase
MRRGTYLLPSLFTFGNILLGFYALVVGLRGEFETAAILVYSAAVIDGLDGRIARLTNTESPFGKELDSLADIVTFGAAPALLAHVWNLDLLGRIGWIVPVFYLLCVAIRLARFNVQTKSVDSRYFVGLPAPAAASTVVSILFFWSTPGDKSHVASGVMLATMIATSVLMISTFRYRSFKELDLRRRWSYRAAALLAVLVLMIVYNPPAVFFSAAIVYSLSGPLEWIIRRLFGLRPRLAERSSPSEPKA